MPCLSQDLGADEPWSRRTDLHIRRGLILETRERAGLWIMNRSVAAAIIRVPGVHVRRAARAPELCPGDRARSVARHPVSVPEGRVSVASVLSDPPGAVGLPSGARHVPHEPRSLSLHSLGVGAVPGRPW